MKILIVDDNDYVRRGVAHILGSDSQFQICGEAKNGEDAIAKARELAPELILLDISMPGMNGLDVARVLRLEGVDAKILIMSQHDPVQTLPRAMDAGAQGCVDKSRLATDLLPYIKSMMNPGESQTA